MRTIGNLTISTPSDREILMTRDFNAPRRLVFDAMTKPELLKRWFFGPDGWVLAVCEIDLRVGGLYRYVWRDESRDYEMGMGGEYLEIVVPEKLRTTEKFDESWYPGEAIGTVTLEEHGDKTALSLHVLYSTKEARDAVLASPMAEGVSGGYDRLAEFLTTVTA